MGLVEYYGPERNECKLLTNTIAGVVCRLKESISSHHLKLARETMSVSQVAQLVEWNGAGLHVRRGTKRHPSRPFFQSISRRGWLLQHRDRFRRRSKGVRRINELLKPGWVLDGSRSTNLVITQLLWRLLQGRSGTGVSHSEKH